VTRHYLDHASTSPLRPEAVAAMTKLMAQPLGDPGRIHTEGMGARVLLEQARESVAELLGARSREVVFTSGATEAIAAGVWGAVQRGIDDDRRHVVLSAVEHSAVRLSIEALEAAGEIEVSVLSVDATGRIDADEMAATVRHDTSLVAVQSANHEVGTVQPLDAVREACERVGALQLVDASQSVGREVTAFVADGYDLLAMGAHKFGGPTGVGALCIRRGLRLEPLLRGADQERARRGGLENVVAAVGLAAVADHLRAGPDDVHQRRLMESAEQRRLTDRLLAGLAGVDGVHPVGHPSVRAPHIVCVTIDGIEPQGVLLGLDQRGIAAHAGSACASADLEPSPVLQAMGVDAHRSLRLSVGWSSTDADVDAVLVGLPEVVAALRALGST